MFWRLLATVKAFTQEYYLDNLQVQEPTYRQEYAIRLIASNSNLNDIVGKKMDNTKTIEKEQ